MSAAGGTPPPQEIVAGHPRHKLFPLADGLRGVAALIIFYGHLWVFNGGYGGYGGDSLANRLTIRIDGVVSFFFVLSAFLLYRPMIANRAGGPRAPGTREYLSRRFLRIYPAYWVALTVLAIVPGLFGVFGSHWLDFYSLGINLDPIYNTATCPPGESYACGLPQSWTLTVEMTFYLALPLYVLLANRLARGRDRRSWVRIELALLAGLTALSLFLCLPPLSLADYSWFEFTFAAHFVWLAIGLGLAVVSVAYENRSDLPQPLRLLAERPALSWAGAIGVYLLSVVVLKPVPFIVASETSPEFLATSLFHAGLALLIVIPVALGDPNSTLPRRVLANPVIAWFGLVSFGFYLWHVTIAYYLGIGGAEASMPVVAILTLLIATPLAAASYYLIERPLMGLRFKRLRPSASRASK